MDQLRRCLVREQRNEQKILLERNGMSCYGVGYLGRYAILYGAKDETKRCAIRRHVENYGVICRHEGGTMPVIMRQAICTMPVILRQALPHFADPETCREDIARIRYWNGKNASQKRKFGRSATARP